MIWQLVDSAFPSGGFAHSGGLEAAVQQGWVTDSAGLLSWAESQLVQAGRGILPAARAVFEDPHAVQSWDAMMDAFLTNPVAHRASRAMGHGWLRAVESLLEAGDRLRLRKAAAGVSHFGPCFGLGCGALGLPLRQMVELFFYLTSRGLLSAAVRLGVIGPMESQQLQQRLAPLLGRESERFLSGHDPMPAPVQTSPIAEIIHAYHDSLYSRLFQT